MPFAGRRADSGREAGPLGRRTLPAVVEPCRRQDARDGGAKGRRVARAGPSNPQRIGREPVAEAPAQGSPPSSVDLSC